MIRQTSLAVATTHEQQRNTRTSRDSRTYGARALVALTPLALALLASAGCGGADGVLPPNVQDPGRVRSAAGALGFYREVVASVPVIADQVVAIGGILTDELAALPVPDGASAAYTALDSRQDIESEVEETSLYGFLHLLRAQAREARGFVDAYVPDTTLVGSKAALGGHLYALEGYAELYLADLFCSGIPLSTVDFGGDYTLTAGFSSADVYRHALGLLDSAAERTADSARLQALAAVGRGRALLALGRYAEAAAAVSDVPDDYLYQVVVGNRPDVSLLLTSFTLNYSLNAGQPIAADREGEVGLDYRSSNDPRTADTLLGTDVRGYGIYFPLKYYPPDASLTFALASGVEARLIEAEAALQSGSGEWLTKLNALRQAVGLADTTDPGTPAARVDLLFRERAFWLYLTGHRQGDLRRLIRQYGRAPEDVYPHGRYFGGTGLYGGEIVIPVPELEQKFNPKYTGCINRNA